MVSERASVELDTISRCLKWTLYYKRTGARGRREGAKLFHGIGKTYEVAGNDPSFIGLVPGPTVAKDLEKFTHRKKYGKGETNFAAVLGVQKPKGFQLHYRGFAPDQGELSENAGRDRLMANHRHPEWLVGHISIFLGDKTMVGWVSGNIS